MGLYTDDIEQFYGRFGADTNVVVLSFYVGDTE